MIKNVCFIVQADYPADVRVNKEVKALQSRGHKVTVISVQHPKQAKYEIVDGVKIHRVGFEKKRAGKFRYLVEYTVFFLHALVKLNALDLRERFDLVHINTLPDFLVFSAFMQKLRGCKIVLDMHEIMPEFFMSKFGVQVNHPIVRLLRFLEKHSLRFADEVITVNDPIKHIFQSRAVPHKDITVIMNTVSGSIVRNRDAGCHTGFNCVYHGTLTDMYGLETAIQGFAKAHKKFPDMLFHIFGEGQSLPQLKRLTEALHLQESVVFHGFIKYEKVLESLAAMDLGILAMRKDVFLNLCFSNKLAEYIYLKIPVISSDLDTFQYYFNGEHVLYFEAANAEDLGNKISFAYTHRQRIMNMAESAYEHAKDFDWDVMAKRYIELVEAN